MINIQDIIPFMKKGWVAMDKSGEWWWYRKKPHKVLSYRNEWEENERSKWQDVGGLNLFDIAPADDWTKSLIQVKGEK